MTIVYFILIAVLYLVIGFVVAVLGTKFIEDESSMLHINEGNTFTAIILLWWLYLFMILVNLFGDLVIVKLGCKLDRFIDKIREDD